MCLEPCRSNEPMLWCTGQRRNTHWKGWNPFTRVWISLPEQECVVSWAGLDPDPQFWWVHTTFQLNGMYALTFTSGSGSTQPSRPHFVPKSYGSTESHIHTARFTADTHMCTYNFACFKVGKAQNLWTEAWFELIPKEVRNIPNITDQKVILSP